MTTCSVSAERHSTTLYRSDNGLDWRFADMVLDHQNKDMLIFEGLVDEHGAVALAVLRRLCGNPHDADLFQEVAVRVWRNLRSRPRLRNPRGWLLTIAYRAFLDHRARRPRLASLDEGDEAFARPGGDPVAVAERVERGRQVERLGAGLRRHLDEAAVDELLRGVGEFGQHG